MSEDPLCIARRSRPRKLKSGRLGYMRKSEEVELTS